MSNLSPDRYRSGRREKVDAALMVKGELYAMRLFTLKRNSRYEIPLFVTSVQPLANPRLQRVTGHLIAADARSSRIQLDLRAGTFHRFGFIVGPDELQPGWPIQEGYLLNDEKLAENLPRVVMRAVHELSAQYESHAS